MTTRAALLAGTGNPLRIVDELIRRDFVSFVIRAFPHLRGGADLLPNWHLDAIAYELAAVTGGRGGLAIFHLASPRSTRQRMASERFNSRAAA